MAKRRSNGEGSILSAIERQKMACGHDDPRPRNREGRRRTVFGANPSGGTPPIGRASRPTRSRRKAGKLRSDRQAVAGSVARRRGFHPGGRIRQHPTTDRSRTITSLRSLEGRGSLSCRRWTSTTCWRTSSQRCMSSTCNTYVCSSSGSRPGDQVGPRRRIVADLTRSPRQDRPNGRTLTPAQARPILGIDSRSPLRDTARHDAGYRSAGEVEALGMKWQHRRAGTITVRRQLTRSSAGLTQVETNHPGREGQSHFRNPSGRNFAAHKAAQDREKLERKDSRVDSEYVFTAANGNPIDPQNFYRAFKGICRKAGLGDWHPLNFGTRRRV